MPRNQQIEAILTKAGIGARRVKALGSYVHIDTFRKYEGALRDLLGNAGFTLIAANDGTHMDGVHGFRMVFLAK